MEDVSTPTINSSLMPKFAGRRVRLVVEILGQMRDADGYTMARASDGGMVKIYTVWYALHHDSIMHAYASHAHACSALISSSLCQHQGMPSLSASLWTMKPCWNTHTQRLATTLVGQTRLAGIDDISRAEPNHQQFCRFRNARARCPSDPWAWTERSPWNQNHSAILWSRGFLLVLNRVLIRVY